MKGNAYKESGVDIVAAGSLVDRIKSHVSKTDRSGVMTNIGAFGAFFDLHKVKKYDHPILISSTDGVGTKLKIALHQKSHGTIGIDCVAMCVNDIVVHGAEPLYFLDYFATGKLDVDIAEHVIAGVAEGCLQAGCALVGGETAEMPGVYRGGDYDLAGFTVGCVEKDNIINGSTIEDGDVILGLASNGVHSNGFSLVRKIIEERPDLSYDRDSYFTEGHPLGEFLLKPTRIYVKPVLDMLAACDNGAVHGMAHITGGGIPENLERIIPDDLHAVIDASSWELPPVFAWIKDMGQIGNDDMLHTFNCGIGMIAVCKADQAASVKLELEKNGETVFELGFIVKGTASSSAQNEKVAIENTDKAWG